MEFCEQCCLEVDRFCPRCETFWCGGCEASCPTCRFHADGNCVPEGESWEQWEGEDPDE